MNPDSSTEQNVSTEAQRQALDAMSAELVGKLNCMIAEQNARVQTFASQYPDAPVSSAPLVEESSYRAPQAPAPQPAPVAPLPTPRPQRSVTPPPTAKPHTETPPPIRPQKPPVAKGKAAAPAKDKSENSIGCGPLIVIIAIIVILLRCCS